MKLANTIVTGLAAAGVAVALSLSGPVLAKGDLTRKPIALADLVMGSEQSDYSFSTKSYELETGKAYKLEIISSGLKEYALQAPEFFASIYLRKVEAGGMEIKAMSLTELEFEDEGSAEIYFVPIKPGSFEFYAEGLQNKGMVGEFVVR